MKDRGEFLITPSEDGESHVLIPWNDRAKQYMERTGAGEVVQLIMDDPRHLKFHRKVRVWLALVWKLCDQKRHISLENLKDNLTANTGHVDISWDFDGVERIKPKSTAFLSMEQGLYEKVYADWMDYVWQNLETIFGVMNDDQYKEITRQLEPFYSDQHHSNL